MTKTGIARKDTSRLQGKLLILDGTSFCYRAYYAIRALSNSKGEPTNAIYGFITMLRKLLDQEQPDYLAICFDRREPTFRHERYTEYKAHRKPMPDDLALQMQPIKDFCYASHYCVFEKAGFEADDLIGTLAKAGEAASLDVYIITGDKDALQLVTDKVKVLNPHKDNELYDPEAVKKRFDGLGPERVVDIMALMGDSSDNIPGVPGIGEKTALKLIQEFGSAEMLIENVEKIKSKKVQELLKQHSDKLLLSKELAQIDTEVAVDLDWEKIKFQPPDEKKLYEFFKLYEFRTLLKDITPCGEAESASRQYLCVDTEEALNRFLEVLRKQKAFSFDTETTSTDAMRAELVGMSFCWEPFQAYYLPVASQQHCGKGLDCKKVLDKVRSILEDPTKKKYGQNLKYDWIVMKRLGVELKGIAFDTMVASYLLNPVKANHNLDDISLEHLAVKKIAIGSLIGKGKESISMAEVPLEKISEYAAEDADCVFRLVPLFEKMLNERGLWDLFVDIEMPLVEILAKMEMNGVCLDLPYLKELSDRAGHEMEELTKTIYELAGESFNINSTKQLAEILFVKMKLPTQKKTKTGFSTDVSVLEKLAISYELPRMILEYREKAKLKSTYLDALPEIIHPETGLVHTSYNQTVTATGRLSSSDPNLQNIPIKTEAGRLVRKAFIPRPRAEGGVILSADYSQIELRILAHLSEDASLMKAFKEDRDIHRYTATLLYQVPEKEVTRDMRNVAKTINFSIIYGKTAYGLSQDLKISIQEADTFIRSYFDRYSGVRDYLEAQKETARRQGYLTTLLNRRAYFPEINSLNMMRRQFAERAAINAPIQGSAADLVKLAMIQIQKAVETELPEDQMIMQVHDELVFDVRAADVEKAVALIREKMEQAYPMRIPLKVDIYTGDSWFKN